MNESNSIKKLPMLALRGITVFPDMVINFDVERQLSVAAVEAALKLDGYIFLLTQKDILKEQPTEADLYKIGTICNIKQMLKMPNGGMRVMVSGIARASFSSLEEENGCCVVQVHEIAEVVPTKITGRTEAVIRRSRELFNKYETVSGRVAPGAAINLIASNSPGFIADYIAQTVFPNFADKQEVLEELDGVKRLKRVNEMLLHEIAVIELEQAIQNKTQEHLAQNQREYVLREQMRIIQNELSGDSDQLTEIDEYRERILSRKLAPEIERKLFEELNRLSKYQFGSSEAAVARTYLDTCLELPWGKYSKERLNIETVAKKLDNDHYGLERIKERILEFLAVRKLAPRASSPIICLVGPPGVGKTSIAMSVAAAIGRKTARISLGGVHDEAEIRGHRKTYIGAMPGRIIAAIKQAGTMNPVLLLDEIDKLGADYRGDPSSALLEALDPEQNSTFRDNYLELPFDLSNVMFITTANTTDTIPRPLLDRMELIEISSYTDEEKLQIAKMYLIPKQRKKHGLKAQQLKISDSVVRDVIISYTKESGVRQLEREIASICRKVASKLVGGEATHSDIRSNELESLLGARKFKPELYSKRDEVGIVNGLAWTSVGGQILEVEVNVLSGSGKLELTGNLGDVMKESAKTAISYIRSRAAKLGIEADFYKTKDIHIHFPEGAVPKDGPSAGLAISIAVISALTERPVRRDIAMTGEITLRGRILPIGGLKEKTMAAYRNGIKTVYIPEDNVSDIEEIDKTVRKMLQFISAEHIDAILDEILLPSADRKEQKSVPEMTAAAAEMRQ